MLVDGREVEGLLESEGGLNGEKTSLSRWGSELQEPESGLTLPATVKERISQISKHC